MKSTASQSFPLLLLSFLSILTVTFSSSNDFSVVNCSSSAMCGAVNISYPFWRYDGPSSFSAYCGYPGFMINCVNDMHAILHIGSGSYNVSNISYANRTIYLIDTDVLTGPELKSCARVRRNLTFTGDIASSSLNYTGADAYLTFFFNCSDAGPPQEFQQNVISCHGYARKSSYVFPSDKVPPEILGSACEDVVVAPVLLDFLRDHSWEPTHGFNEAPNYGFQLAWFPGAPEGCKECESSSRLCGFNKTSSHSLCFCSDGTLARDCPSGNVSSKMRTSKESSARAAGPSAADRGKGIAE